MKKITGPDLCHCLAARRSARFLTRLYDQHFAAVNLSASQHSLLAMVAEHPGISILALAGKMVMERTTLVRALKPLQAAGFITSRPEGTRGALTLFLPEAGQAKLKEAEPYWRKAQKDLEALVGQDHMAGVRASLLMLTAEA